MSTYMTLEEYTATLKVGDEVTIKYYSITGEKEIKEKILKITKSGTIYLRSTNCKDALRFRKNGHWINNFGYHGKYYVPEWAVKAFEEGILYFDALTPDTPPIELFIKTLEGTMHAPVGSYVIQGVRGEIYCCKEDIFLETYEPVLERE